MADFVVGAKLQFDGSEGIKSMRDLKGAIKDAQLDLINMQNKFGETSQEAINAAKRVNELRDKIKDAAEVTELFDPGKKFQAATNAVNGLVGGFTALTGAMGLLGIESDNVQKQLLKVQSAMALTQGLSSIADSAKDFKRLGDVLLNTFGKGGVIGIAIAGVAALGAAIYSTLTGAKELSAEQKVLNDVTKEAAKLYATERAQLEANKRALESENVSRSEKERIIKSMREQYPNIFRDLDIENGKVVGLTEGYKKLIRVIELKARATAAASLLAKQEEELLQQGFAMGITTEDQAMALLDQLSKRTDLVGSVVYANAKRILDQRNFLKQIQLEAEKALAGANAGNSGGGAKPDEPKDNKKRLESELAETSRRVLAANELNASLSIENAQSGMSETEKKLFELELEFKKRRQILELGGKDLTELNKWYEEQQTNIVLEEIGKRVKRKNEDAEKDKEIAKNKSAAIAEITSGEFGLQRIQLDEWYKTRLELVRGNEELETKLKQEYAKRKKAIDDAQTSSAIANVEAERQTKIMAYQQIGSAFGALSNLVGQQTAAGKAFAIAQVAIDTAVAISGAVRQASKNPLNLTGFAFVADMAARVAAIIGTIARAKQILSKANVGPSGSGGDFKAPVQNTQAPLQMQPVQASLTRLDQNQLNQIGNAAVRAFVVESDVTNNQERIRRLNRAARLG